MDVPLLGPNVLTLMEWICMRALFSDKAAMLRVSYALHQCVFIACTEYDHLLFTACSLSADIVAGNPSSGAVLVDPHEDRPSRATQVSRSALHGLETVFGRSNGRPWNTTAEWAPVERRSA